MAVKEGREARERTKEDVRTLKRQAREKTRTTEIAQAEADAGPTYRQASKVGVALGTR